MEKDQVCGMLVDPKKASGQKTHGGKTYYFCSTACRDKFAKAPERYVQEEQKKK